MTKYIQPPRSEECEWRSGPPPEIGWWPADWHVRPQPDCLRWWDGSEWSFCAHDSASASLAAGRVVCMSMVINRHTASLRPCPVRELA